MHYTRDDYRQLYGVRDDSGESWLAKLTIGAVLLGFVVAVVLVFLNLERTAPVPAEKMPSAQGVYEKNPLPLSHPLPYTATVEYVEPNGKVRVRHYVPKEKQ